MWGWGIGDWDGGWGMGDWAQPPIPNPQSPIPNPHIFYSHFIILIFNFIRVFVDSAQKYILLIRYKLNK